MDFYLLRKNIGKNVSGKYSQQFLGSAKKFGAIEIATYAIKTAWKRAIQKTAEVTGDIVCNEIADKITKATNTVNKNEAEISKEVHILLEKRQQVVVYKVKWNIQKYQI